MVSEHGATKARDAGHVYYRTECACGHAMNTTIDASRHTASFSTEVLALLRGLLGQSIETQATHKKLAKLHTMRAEYMDMA